MISKEQPIDPDRWVDEHGDALYGYALLRFRDAEVAADLVQETFLQAWKGRSAFRGESSERTWLVGILKHKILDRFRSRSASERGLGGDDGEGNAPVESLSAFFDDHQQWRRRPGDWGALPDELVERAEFWEVFHACLADLPEIYAEAFTLAELEGMAGPEICEVLRIKPTNLWARLHRARLMLRERLEVRWFGREA